MTIYWQHESPLQCLASHSMYWLGGDYWVCPICHKVYVEQRDSQETGESQ